jgi:hypothetical protein
LFIRSSATLSPCARRSAEYEVHRIVWLSRVRRSQSPHGVGALSVPSGTPLTTRAASVAAAAISALRFFFSMVATLLRAGQAVLKKRDRLG